MGHTLHACGLQDHTGVGLSLSRSLDIRPSSSKASTVPVYRWMGQGRGLEKIHDLIRAFWPPGPTMNPSFLLAFLLLLALSTPCSTCWCKFQHPQMYYCNSDIGESRETPEESLPRSHHGVEKRAGGGTLVI